jgi:hypothetical protein
VRQANSSTTSVDVETAIVDLADALRLCARKCSLCFALSHEKRVGCDDRSVSGLLPRHAAMMGIHHGDRLRAVVSCRTYVTVPFTPGGLRTWRHQSTDPSHTMMIVKSGRCTFFRLTLRGGDIRSLFFQNEMRPQRERGSIFSFELKASSGFLHRRQSAATTAALHTSRPILQPPDFVDATPRRKGIATFHLPKLELPRSQCAALTVVRAGRVRMYREQSTCSIVTRGSRQHPIDSTKAPQLPAIACL